MSIRPIGGGGGGSITPEVNEFLQNITWDGDTRRASLEGSFEVLPSSFYMGEFTLSNGVQAVMYRLADGTRAISLVNRFNPALGTISNPKFFALGAQDTLEVETVDTDIIADGFTTQYQTAGNNLTFDFDFIPASSGIFRAEYWIGTNENGNKIFDEQRMITESDVLAGVPMGFEVGNPYILEGQTNLFVRFTGIDLKGNSATGLPYFVSKILPYTEVTVNGHVIAVNSDITPYIGCDYSADTSAGPVTFTVPLGFTDRFRVFDGADSISPTNKVVIDLSAFSQGTAELVHRGDDAELYYVDGDGWYINDIKGQTRSRV